MGAYREQLLRESGERHPSCGGQREESSGFFTMLKLKFLICLFLFAGFVWMDQTGESLGTLTAEKVAAMVTSQELPSALAEFRFSK